MDQKDLITTQEVSKVTAQQKTELTSIAEKVIELIRNKHT